MQRTTNREGIREYVRRRRAEDPALKPEDLRIEVKEKFDADITRANFYATFWSKAAPEEAPVANGRTEAIRAKATKRMEAAKKRGTSRNGNGAKKKPRAQAAKPRASASNGLKGHGDGSAPVAQLLSLPGGRFRILYEVDDLQAALIVLATLVTAADGES